FIMRFDQEDYAISKVLVRVVSVELRTKEDGNWITAKDYGAAGHEMDFVTLHDGGVLPLDEYDIAPGSYDAMRITFKKSNKILVDEGQGEKERHLQIPFFSPTTVMMAHEFTVLAGAPSA